MTIFFAFIPKTISTGISGQLAGAHLTYKDRVRMHIMQNCDLSTGEIANNIQMTYTTVHAAVSFHFPKIVYTNFLVGQSHNTKTIKRRVPMITTPIQCCLVNYVQSSAEVR